jgi:hypothetical protein
MPPEGVSEHTFWGNENDATDEPDLRPGPRGRGALAQDMNFNRVASFATPANMAEGEDRSRESSAEIITATATA